LHCRTPLDIARRILRKENYLIAMLESPIFHVALPLPSFLTLSSHVVLSRNMEWNLHWCLLDHLFDENHDHVNDKSNDIPPQHKHRLNPILRDVAALQKRFVTIGMVNVVLTPFLLVFRSIQFFLLSTQEWYVAKTSSLSTRRWSPTALWMFREYNEWPHVFDARMARATPAAEAYLHLFPSGIVSIVATGISFCAGSIMAVLILVSLIEEQILMDIEVVDRPLLWYLTIATGLFVIARTFHPHQNYSPPSSSTTTSKVRSGAHFGGFMQGRGGVDSACEDAMARLAADTHHFPPAWRG
jgi:autophagy-related protein 9